MLFALFLSHYGERRMPNAIVVYGVQFFGRDSTSGASHTTPKYNRRT